MTSRHICVTVGTNENVKRLGGMSCDGHNFHENPSPITNAHLSFCIMNITSVRVTDKQILYFFSSINLKNYVYIHA